MEFHISASVPSVQREILWGAEGDCSEAWESPDSGAGDISEPSRMLHKSELSLPPSHKKEQRSAEKKLLGVMFLLLLQYHRRWDFILVKRDPGERIYSVL